MEAGCTFVAASANAGIAYSTYRLWANLGEKAKKRLEEGEPIGADERRYISFLEAIEDAKGIALLTWQQTIDKAARVDPAWAWKMLQVRAPEDYTMPQQRLDVTSGGESINRITTIEVVHHLPANETTSRDS